MKYHSIFWNFYIKIIYKLLHFIIFLGFLTGESQAVINSNRYQGIFTREIYDVSPIAQKRYLQARDIIDEEGVNQDKYLASLAHKAAENYPEEHTDYLAVAVLYYQKFQCVNQRLIFFLRDSKDFLETTKHKLDQIYQCKANWNKASSVLDTIVHWSTAVITGGKSMVLASIGSHLLASFCKNIGNETLDFEKYNLEINKEIKKINTEINQIEKGVRSEPIAILEEVYVKQKIANSNSIKKDLQDTIEENLINSRNPLYPFPFVKKCLENSLKLPQKHKELSLSRLQDLKSDKFLERYSLDTRIELENVAIDLVHSSLSSDDASKVPLRSVCYFHGEPGIGKTEAVLYLAKFFDLPFVKLNIRSIEDLSSHNLEGGDAFSSEAALGWLARPFLTFNSEGKTYQNAILILDEFDRILLDENSSVTSLAFFLDFLDPLKKSFYSPYFNAEIDISRMHIFVTGNSFIPASPRYQALRERFSQIVPFEPMKNEHQKGVLGEYLLELAEFYNLSQEDLTNQKNFLVGLSIELAENPSSLRSCKQQLRNIVRDFKCGGRERIQERRNKISKNK